MYQIRVTVLLFIFKLSCSVCCVNSQSCDAVDIGVYYQEVQNSGDEWWNFTQVTDCISDKSFPGQKVANLWVAKVDFPNIKKKFISNMQYLQEIYIEKTHLETIEPGAFYDLPQIKRIDIYNNPIKNISKGVFNVLPTLEMILIYLTKVSYIEEGAFANLPNLKEIGLNENSLDYLNREWFTNTNNIEHFSVFRNLIRKVPEGMFHGWKNLKNVSLNSNDISDIEGELLKDNSEYMTSVALNHNRLMSIDMKTLPDSVYIGSLALHGNLLNYVPEEFLRNIRVGSIFIHGNPLSCPCWTKINQIFQERSVTVDDSKEAHVTACKDSGVPVCGLPSDHSHTCVETVDEKLTHRFLSYLKVIRYDAVRDEKGVQCARFDYLH